MSSVAQLEAEIATVRGEGGDLRKIINPVLFENIKLIFFNMTGQGEFVTPEFFVSLRF